MDNFATQSDANKMPQTPRFALVVLLLFTSPCFSEEGTTLTPSDRMYLENIRYLCEWAKTKAPKGEQGLRLGRAWESALGAKDAAESKKQRDAEAKVARDKLVRSIPSMSVPQLCGVIRKGKVPEAVEALARRRAFASDDIGLLSRGAIALGMSEDAMMCLLGSPEDSNRNVGSWGVHTQHVYDDMNVYTENGKVTSWQD